MSGYKLLLGVSLVALASCGGGGGDDDSGGNSTTPPPVAQSASGVWNGTVTVGQDVNDATCLVAETGDLACIFTDPANGGVFAGGARGTVTVSNGDQVSGSGTSYAAPGYLLADGSVVADFSITGGTVSEGNTIELTISTAGAAGNMSAAYDPIYERDSSLSTVAASYVAFDIFGDPASFSIDSSGALFTQAASGCVANGQVSIIDSQFNAYAVDATVSNCPGLNGTYEGLGISADFQTSNDSFVFALFNGSVAIFGAPLK